MAICEGCIFRRSKMHDSSLIECKHPSLASSSGNILNEMYLFMGTGTSRRFFTVMANSEVLKVSKNGAWPLQFESSVIANCEGFKA